MEMISCLAGKFENSPSRDGAIAALFPKICARSRALLARLFSEKKNAAAAFEEMEVPMQKKGHKTTTRRKNKSQKRAEALECQCWKYPHVKNGAVKLASFSCEV